MIRVIVPLTNAARRKAVYMMSEAAQHLVNVLRRDVKKYEDQADELAFLAQVADDASAAVALYNMARTKRVRALEFLGQIAALRVQYGMI